MTAALHLCSTEDLEKLVPMVRAFHQEMEITTDEPHIRSALAPILEGSPHAAVYLVGPRVAPVGYVLVVFGYSLEYGGIDGYIDEFFIRPKVRGRGMGSEVLQGLAPALANAGVKSLCLEVDRTDAKAQRLYTRNGFELRDRFSLMARKL